MKKDYTIDELSAKIEAIKSERERTANALKKYEEELERRKTEVPLGVPFVPKTGEEYWWVDIGGNPIHSFFEGGHVDFQVLSECGCFKSYASAVKHAKMLKEWRKDGLVAISKGEPIDIKVLLPLMKKGWVATDENGDWFWYKCKPLKETNYWGSRGNPMLILSMFNIKPAENWKDSLMECGL